MKIDYSKIGYRTYMTCDISSCDQEIYYSNADREFLELDCDNYYYATIQKNNRREIIKVYKTSINILFVERGINSSPLNWKYGTNINIDWNVLNLSNFIKDTKNDLTCLNISGCYDLKNIKSIEINNQGQIKEINKYK